LLLCRLLLFSIYHRHDKYKFVGYLIDPRFYDEDGNPTTKMLELRGRMKIALEEQEKKKAENARKRAERQKQREEEKKKKQQQQQKQ
jgi:hypothetical protein